MNVRELQVKIAKEFGLEDAIYEARKKSFELKMKVVNKATKQAKLDKEFGKNNSVDCQPSLLDTFLPESVFFRS